MLLGKQIKTFMPAITGSHDSSFAADLFLFEEMKRGNVK
jgi:hypothetical protein